MATAQFAPDGGPQYHDATASVEQRAAPRYTLLLRQARLHCRTGEFLCVIRDVSETGLSIRTFHPLPPDHRMAIELVEKRPHLIEKVWEKEGEAGFRFKDAVSLDELLADDARFPRRQFRIEIDYPVEMCADGVISRASFTNLSQQGACLRCDRLLARDQLLSLRSPMLPGIEAKVRWRRDNIHGLVFEQTFSFRDFANLVARIQSVA
ncbi:PilZ domain-containing protein [Parerythrobacter aestuarii]|uniref:PilZ domain-containing protein n=1 Tax=Parerythrobacter aestuarii TaxID=3020909 RepID=UPI0024DECCAD|nr:PilZ domain-containing protein [Parerythrobacter aestuarii]